MLRSLVLLFALDQRVGPHPVVLLVLTPRDGQIVETFEAWGAYVYRAPIGAP